MRVADGAAAPPVLAMVPSTRETHHAERQQFRTRRFHQVEGPGLSGFLFALLAALLASVGARDHVLLTQLARAQGRRPLLLVMALVAGAGCSALAAWLGGRMLGDMASAARALFAALALLLAGGEMLLLRPGRPPEEPTNSLFAAFIVFAGLQITDASRFLILALAVGTAAPIPAGIGGAVGTMGGLVWAWIWPDLVAARRTLLARRAVGGMLLTIGLALGVPNVIGIPG